MIKITKYKTFDGMEFKDYTTAKNHLKLLENTVLNKIALDISLCNLAKIKDQDSLYHLKKCENTDSYLYRRHYILYYIDEHLNLFKEIEKIREDLVLIDNDDD